VNPIPCKRHPEHEKNHSGLQLKAQRIVGLFYKLVKKNFVPLVFKRSIDRKRDRNLPQAVLH
jgi:hypothetical protein